MLTSVLLLHSAYGLRPAVRDLAADLARVGLRVVVPDYYGGLTFTDVGEALAARDALLEAGPGGFAVPPVVAEAAAGLGPAPILAGLSLGVGLAHGTMSALAADGVGAGGGAGGGAARPGDGTDGGGTDGARATARRVEGPGSGAPRALVCLHGTGAVGAAAVPAGLSVLALLADPDPFELAEEVAAWRAALTAAGASVEVVTRPGVGHLFTDPGLPDWDPGAAAAAREATVAFVREACGRGLTVRQAAKEDLQAAFALRYEVFVDEQHVPIEEELDARDATCRHVVATLDGTVVGTGRLLEPEEPGGAWHLGRIAVRAGLRGHGVGARIVGALEQLARAADAGGQGPGVVETPGTGSAAVAADGARSVRLELSAQVGALDFYRRLGWTVTGPVYLDAGIEHRDAYREIPALRA